MNPYASKLGDRDPLVAIASVRQIVRHLADSEIASRFRLRQALAEPGHVIQPFDQERWADRERIGIANEGGRLPYGRGSDRFAEFAVVGWRDRQYDYRGLFVAEGD